MSRSMRFLIHSWVLLAGCATADTAMAEPLRAPSSPARTETLTLEAVLGLSAVDHARISPDGRVVAYELMVPRNGPDAEAGPGLHARREIWLVPTDGGPARRATTPIHDAEMPRWSPDGQTLAFISKREAHHDKPQIFVMDPDFGEAYPISSVSTGVVSFAWSPNGASIAFTATASDDDERKAALEAGRDWLVGGQHRGHRRLWSLDVATGQIRSLVSDMHVDEMAFSPDGKELLLSASAHPDPDTVFMRKELYRLDMASGARTQLTRRTPAKLGGFAWSPDGTRIAFLAGVDGNDPLPASVFIMAATGGEAVNITGSYPGSIESVQWYDDDELVIAGKRGPHTVVRRIPAASRGLEVETTRVPADDAIEPMCTEPHFTKDLERYACAASSAVHPREVYIGELAAPRRNARQAAGSRAGLRRLTISNPALERTRFASQEVIRWKSVDGMEIGGILIKPLDFRTGQKYPLVVLPHGGPEGSRQNDWLAYPGQLLAARGMVALYPNYRGSGGHGVAFSKADHRDLGGKEFADVLAGIDHLDRLGMIDSKRVGIAGWSYGGYFSALGATQHSDRFAVAVVGAAITNWTSFMGTTDIPEENKLVHWALDTYDNDELAWQRSPLAHVKRSKTATLVVHGENDERVPVTQGIELYRALKRYKVDTELVIYPREQHSLREQAHIADVRKRTLEWLERHLQ